MNDAFCSPDGSFSISKTIAVFAQIAVLFHMGKSFPELVKNPESMLIVLSFLVCPDILKKFIAMKFAPNASKT